MKYYLYCVAETISSETQLPLGIMGAGVRFLKFADLTVVVSEFDRDVVSLNRENVLAHEAVVRAIFAESTPLPFRFATIISEAKLRSFIESRKASLAERLSLVRHAAEMNVKIIWPRTLDKAKEDKLTIGVGAGAAFLQAKRRELVGDEELESAANEIGGWLASGVRSCVRQQSLNIQPKQKLVVAGAFLMDRTRESDFRTVIGQLEQERSELHFLTSGPWAPYTFANIDLEFETQFGVS
ncbi:MAG TPA: GvpL/GvpF family gas vesicle protein [Pyrinomonadaceae bacterium]